VLRIPPGFRLERGPGTLVVARLEMQGAARELGLLERNGLDQLFRNHEPGETGRAATRLVPLPGGAQTLIVRRLHHGGWLGGWLNDRFLSPKRPIRELVVTASLREEGVPVPVPALVAGLRRRGFWRLGYATVFEKTAIDAQRWLESKPGASDIASGARALGKAVRQFHDAGGHHADLHLKNLLLLPGDDGEPWGMVIDLDGTRFILGMTPEERMTQLMRLFRSVVKRNVVENIGARGCAHFLSAYCEDDRALRRAMWRSVDVELRRIAIHRLGYWRRRPAADAT